MGILVISLCIPDPIACATSDPVRAQWSEGLSKQSLSYLGGTGYDYGVSNAVDPRNGDMVIFGFTDSVDFPMVNAFQDENHGGDSDMFLAKIAGETGELLFSTYIGGSGVEYAYDVTIADNGTILLVGSTNSNDFPITNNALQSESAASFDGFLTTFDPEGQLQYSTFIGGNGWDAITAVVQDERTNRQIFAGITSSQDFPTTDDAFQPTNAGGYYDGFLTVFSADERRLFHSTYFGGSARDLIVDLALDSDGNVIVGGHTFSTDLNTTEDALAQWNSGQCDCYISKFTQDGSLLFSTYVGGTAHDYFNGLDIDTQDNVVFAGSTISPTYPTTTNAYQPIKDSRGEAFITKLDSAGSCVFSTFLGGSHNDAANSVCVLGDGSIAVAGQTASMDYPTTFGALRTELNDGEEISLSILSADGSSLEYSTYLGGGGDDVALAVNAVEDGLCLSGYTDSTHLLTLNAHQPYLANVTDCVYYQFKLSSVVHSSNGSSIAESVEVDASLLMAILGFLMAPLLTTTISKRFRVH